MKQRAITAFIFAGIMLGGIYWNILSFQVLFTVIAAGALWELTGILFRPGSAWRTGRRLIGCLTGLFPVIWMGIWLLQDGAGLPETGHTGLSSWQADTFHLGLVFGGTAFFILCLFLIELFIPDPTPAETIGHYLLGLFYIGIPIIALFELATPGSVYLPHRVFGLIWLIWTNDTFAYLIGSQLGRTKLFERISPKKTWEGTFGGMAGAMLMAWGLSFWLGEYTPVQWLALGAIVGVIGTLGDLVESMLKRSVGIKDSGTIMPGHGGLLDRFDSFLFVAPFAWLVVKMLGG
ncbi:MAG: phosphatidate cytidylyltransferase [Bacteroidetes bacterium]|nr:MAG: phosphatidate cytidylyltransferase [Bacteroidota bacterium]